MITYVIIFDCLRNVNVYFPGQLIWLGLNWVQKMVRMAAAGPLSCTHHALITLPPQHVLPALALARLLMARLRERAVGMTLAG